MRIGIDFDDTIVKTSEKVNEYMKKYNISHFNNFDEENEFYNKYLVDMTKEVELKENVVKVLNKLSLNNDLYLITARSSIDLIKITKEFIKKNNLPFKELYFDCYGIDKLNKCKELNIDLFIDDDLLNIEETSKYINTIYFNGHNDKYKCIDNWNDILKEVYDG